MYFKEYNLKRPLLSFIDNSPEKLKYKRYIKYFWKCIKIFKKWKIKKIYEKNILKYWKMELGVHIEGYRFPFT